MIPACDVGVLINRDLYTSKLFYLSILSHSLFEEVMGVSIRHWGERGGGGT